MRTLTVVAASALLLAAGGFFVGRMTAPSTEAPGGSFGGGAGDVFEVPAAAVRCEVTQEADAPGLICRHTPVTEARHDVVIDRDNLLVFRVGEPETPAFSARGRP